MRYLLFCLLATFIIGCGDNRVTGIETTNGFAGVIHDDQGPLEGAIVSLYPVEYNPVTSSTKIFRDTTDAQGGYAFRELDTGTYNIITVSPMGDVALTQNIEIHEDQDTLIRIGIDIVQSPAQINISLSELNLTDKHIIYIPGTELFTSITNENISAGYVTLRGAPSGDYEEIRLFEESSLDTNLIQSSFIVPVTSELYLGPYVNWSQRYSISINTASTGADISNDLHSYPLLIRLTAENFDFSKSQKDGSDIRFTKSNHFTPLPYEIERWDFQNQMAEIWVHVDTIYASRDTQSLILFTGNNSALTASAPSTVFDTSLGFAGVWHLSEEATDSAGSIFANSTGEFAVGNNFKTSTSTSEGIGRGQFFNKFDYIQVENPPEIFKPRNNITWGAWFKSDSTSANDRGTLITLGASYGIRFSASGGIMAFIYSNNTFLNTDSTSLNLKDDKWHLVNGVYDGVQLSLYVDGLQMNNRALTTDIQYTATVINQTDSVRHDIRFGMPGASTNDYLFYEGAMDEVRISKTARSAEWIKMDFESQKPDNSVVTVKLY